MKRVLIPAPVCTMTDAEIKDLAIEGRWADVWSVGRYVVGLAEEVVALREQLRNKYKQEDIE